MTALTKIIPCPGAGSDAHRLICWFDEAPEIVQPVRPFSPNWRLTSEFRQWLFDHLDFRIRVDLADNSLRITFPTSISAMAFKIRWA